VARGEPCEELHIEARARVCERCPVESLDEAMERGQTER
jgi:hypothetical protein